MRCPPGSTFDGGSECIIKTCEVKGDTDLGITSNHFCFKCSPGYKYHKLGTMSCYKTCNGFIEVTANGTRCQDACTEDKDSSNTYCIYPDDCESYSDKGECTKCKHLDTTPLILRNIFEYKENNGQLNSISKGCSDGASLLDNYAFFNNLLDQPIILHGN